LSFVGDALIELPARSARDREARRRRHRDKRVLVARLAALVDAGRPGREADPAAIACSVALAEEIAAVNADPFELDALLEQQAYRLAHWSVAANQLSYRRFFDINTLVGMRSEELDVFEATHAKVLELVRTGALDGLRVDHVDGLRDPEAYLRRLVERAPRTWIVVEKILSVGESVPATWPVDGTTGYELAELLGGLLVDPAGEPALTRLFEEFTGEPFDPRVASRAARLAVMSDALHSELARLTELAVRACAQSPMCRDYTGAEIEAALAEILAGYPTYRRHMTPERRTEIDRARLAAAVAAARDARPELDADLLAFLERALA